MPADLSPLTAANELIRRLRWHYRPRRTSKFVVMRGAMRPFVKLPGPLVIITVTTPRHHYHHYCHNTLRLHWGGSGISWTMCKSFAPRFGQITMPASHHSIFTGRMLFLIPNQQCQSTEGKYLRSCENLKII